jgi:hypothetical protein
MNKRFATAVLRNKPEFASCDVYFYYTPAAAILCGFVFEETQRHAFIRRFARPLYENLEFLNLSYAERLKYPAGSTLDLESGAHTPSEFIRQIEPHEPEVRSWQDLQVFLNHFEDPKTLGNPRVRRTVAFTYVLLGKSTEAHQHLDHLLHGEAQQIGGHFAQETHQVKEALASSLDRAQRILRLWESETKQRLQLR